jgi:hypothetical protein
LKSRKKIRKHRKSFLDDPEGNLPEESNLDPEVQENAQEINEADPEVQENAQEINEDDPGEHDNTGETEKVENS